MENVFLSLMDDVVFYIDFCLFLGPLSIQLQFVFLLFIQLDLFVIDPARERLDLWLDVSELVLSYLEVGFRAETHVCNLCQTSLVFLPDLNNLGLSVLSDLLHRFVVVSLHRLNIVAKVSDLLVFFCNSVLVILLLLVHLLCVLLVDRSLGVSKLSSLLLLLFL